MKNPIALGTLVLATLLAMVLATGCGHDVIEAISVFRAQPDAPVPTGGWALTQRGPHPSEVQGVFQPEDKQFLGLAFAEDSGDNIYLSRITFYNKATGAEEEAAVMPADLGPYRAGNTYLIGYEDPWGVPGEAGEYRLRIYVGDDVVASAPFLVD
jgi:hypothetical protein